MPNLMTPFGTVELVSSSDGKSLFRTLRDATATPANLAGSLVEITTSKEVNNKKGEARQLLKVTYNTPKTVGGVAVGWNPQTLHLVRTYRTDIESADEAARDGTESIARALAALSMALLNPHHDTGVIASNVQRLDKGMTPVFSAEATVLQTLVLDFA